MATMAAMACPNAANHYPEPPQAFYLDRLSWAMDMLKTHVQWQCPACGKWVIWIPKGPVR